MANLLLNLLLEVIVASKKTKINEPAHMFFQGCSGFMASIFASRSRVDW